MSDIHCKDLAGDRRLGAFWERQFCLMMASRGKMFTPLQIGRTESAQAYYAVGRKWHHLTLPDVTVWTAPGEHHEIKHKTTTRANTFGLERYRLDALLAFAEHTQQAVFYTIHDHHGEKHDTTNRRADWITANVMDLRDARPRCSIGQSWVAGRPTSVPILYWSRDVFLPLFGNVADDKSIQAWLRDYGD